MLSSMQSVSAVFRRLSTLRTAVLTLTSLTFLFSLAVCTGIWLILREFESLKDMYWAEGDVVAPVLTASQMGGIIPVGIMWTLLCAISIVGFVGAVKNHFRITSAYCTLVWTHYVVDFIVGLWFFYVLYSSSWRLLLEVCSEDKSADFHLDKTVCAIPESKLKAAYVGTFFVGKLIGFGRFFLQHSFDIDLFILMHRAY
ncbi:hypothetical protein FRC02_011577 [Tulasnella sp. 418]|nr:hypothetical protein FRC02_011577 [Tulasnella sp. 418]